jgi:hypothetical protein
MSTNRIPDHPDNARFLPTQIVIDVANRMAHWIVDPADVTDDEHRTLQARFWAEMKGECPECGARITFPNRRQRRAAMRQGGFIARTMVHEDDCPAANPAVPTVLQMARDAGLVREATL